jgi:hypothetical protein
MTSKARPIKIMAIKHQVAMRAYQRELNRINDEIQKIEKRAEQIVDLAEGYRLALRQPELLISEYRDTTLIISRLNERQTIDTQKRDLLLVERQRLNQVIAEKSKRIENLDEKVKEIKKIEIQTRDELRERLMPARRS